MTATELLSEVKTRLSVTGNYHDSTLTALSQDVKEYVASAGANAESSAAVGVIARGVADLWNFGSGDGKFSEVFYQRLSQLVLEKTEVTNEQEGISTDISSEDNEQSDTEMQDSEERPPLYSGTGEGGDD